MARVFKYRLVKASWGVAIDLTAEAQFPSAVPDNTVKIKDRLWLAIVPPWLSKEEQQCLQLGLTLVADAILECKPDDPYILVRVLDVQFNPCHYQAEGLAAAIADWAAQEFAFEPVKIPIALDRDRKRYLYRFPQSGDPLCSLHNRDRNGGL